VHCFKTLTVVLEDNMEIDLKKARTLRAVNALIRRSFDAIVLASENLKDLKARAQNGTLDDPDWVIRRAQDLLWREEQIKEHWEKLRRLIISFNQPPTDGDIQFAVDYYKHKQKLEAAAIGMIVRFQGQREDFEAAYAASK
jgi:hypothetical protein